MVKLSLTKNSDIMIIFRVDGSKCFSEPIKGLGYFTTKELAENYLIEKGYYLETRKWNHIIT